MKKFIKTRIYGGNVKTIRMVNQPEIVDYIKNNPGQTESKIMSNIYDFERGGFESNKKYADCLRRALHSGKIRREEVKGKSYKFIYYINDLPKVEPKKEIVYSSQIKNDNMSKELKVTTELRKILLDLGYISKNTTVFSDPRRKKQAVGVKVCRLFLNENQVRSVIIKMGELGFELVNYKAGIKYTTNSWRYVFSGDRFTFYKHSSDKAKKDNVYLSKLKSKDMNNSIKIEGRLEMINLSAPVEMGPLKVNLIAQVIVVKGKIDCIEFVDLMDQTYNGMEISDWKKFVNMNKEWGIDYSKVLNEKFDEIFEESVVKEILGLGN
jgi:hypothetical protein